MNLFLREMRAHLKSLLIWCVSMFVGILAGMSKFTAYSQGGASSKAIEDLPKSLKAVFGMGSFDVTHIAGFFAFLFLYLEVTAAIHAALLGSSVFTHEERDKTADFLMTKPVSRQQVLRMKLLAAFVSLVVFNLVCWGSSAVLVPAFAKGASIGKELASFYASMLIVQLLFLLVGTALSVTLRRPGAAGSASAGVVLGGYAVYMITALTDKLNFLRVLSPFTYFNFEHMVQGSAPGLLPTVLTLLLCAAFAVLTAFSFQKRDFAF